MIMTIHMPSSELIMEFDRVIFLSESYTIYNGSPENIKNYFGELGLNYPKNSNPADQMMKLACQPMRMEPKGMTIEELAEFNAKRQLQERPALKKDIGSRLQKLNQRIAVTWPDV